MLEHNFSRRGTRVLAIASFVMAAACGGGGGHSGGDGGMDASTDITVTGTVIDSSTGSMVAGATILIVGKTPVVSDASGHFTVTGVTAPYDVVVRAGGASSVRVYDDLTRADPTLVARAMMETTNSATLSGAVTVTGTMTDDSLVC